MIPEVTVVITVYRRVQYLQQAIASVLKQTLPPCEIIVADDSSSANIKAICDSFVRPDIRYKVNLIRLGVALNVRDAISEAKGKYVAILNDDDVWMPEFLEKLTAPLEEDQERVLAFSDHWVMSADGQIDRKKTEENTRYYGRNDLRRGEVSNLEELAFEKNGIPLAMAAVFRKDAIALNLFFKEVEGAYDFWMSCLLAASGKSAYYVPERLTCYRVHGAMESGRRAPEKNANLLFIYQKLIELNYFRKRKNNLSKKYGQSLFCVGKDNLFFDHTVVARDYYFRSLMAGAGWKAIAGLLISYLPRKVRVVLKFTQ